MEGGGSSRVEERDEGAGLFGEDANALDRAEADLTEELVDGGIRGEVADVDGATLRREKSQKERRKKNEKVGRTVGV